VHFATVHTRYYDLPVISTLIFDPQMVTSTHVLLTSTHINFEETNTNTLNNKSYKKSRLKKNSVTVSKLLGQKCQVEIVESRITTNVVKWRNIC
jgi:hypothetical protein